MGKVVAGYYLDDPVFRVWSIDEMTKEKVLHYESQNEVEARRYFQAFISPVVRLKDWREVQKNAKKYTEVLLMKGFYHSSNEFPIRRGFMETRYLKEV